MSRLDGRERLVHLTIAYGLLAVSVIAAVAFGDGAGGPRPGTPALAVAPWLAGTSWPPLAVLAALWLAPLGLPRREGRLRRGSALPPAWGWARRVPVVVHHAGLVAIAGALVACDAAFTVFASAGYLLATALLPGRLVIAGVALTAAAVVLGQAGADDPAGLLVVIGGLALPLAVAGWYVSAESDRRRRLVEELRAALAENAALHARLLDQARHAGVLDERQRVAGEIHDTVAQDLAAVVGQLAAADAAAGEPERRRHLDRASALARSGLAEARRAVRALRPGPLEDSRLPDALTRLAAEWEARTGLALAVEITGTPVALAADVEDTLFRVAQEALTNVAKHAGARRAALTLSYTDLPFPGPHAARAAGRDGGPRGVLLDVRDDGRGFDLRAPGDGFGLDGMRQRVRGVGGTLEVESEPGRGTAVAAAVPAIPPEGRP
uniref:sensor histidine kinase n=1 Tax=Nonomuraea pusilla TaxID=46177 RepID=UPI0006E371C0|nr:sensor histidine kinase [Nonomuraea pusilla]